MNTPSDIAVLSKKRIALFSAGGLIGLPVCLLLFGFFRFACEVGLNMYAVIGAAAFAALLCAFLFPPLYEAVSSLQSVSHGRYHLPFALSALIFSVCVACLFSVFEGRVAGTVAVCVTFPLIFISLPVYLSAFNSLRLRVLGERTGPVTAFRIAAVFLAAGAVTVYAAIGRPYFSDLGYLFSAVGLLASASVYFSCAPLMPRFIKVEAPQKTSYAQKLKRFYAPLKKSAGKQAFIGFAFLAFALCLLVMNGYHILYAALGALYAAAGLGALAVCALVLFAVGARAKNRGTDAFSRLRRADGIRFNSVNNLKNVFLLFAFAAALSLSCALRLLTSVIPPFAAAIACGAVCLCFAVIGGAVYLTAKKKLAEGEGKHA